MSEVITVKVIRVPGSVSEVGLESGSTVGQALEAANVSVGSGESVKLGGADTTMDAVVTDGARVLIAKAAKGA